MECCLLLFGEYQTQKLPEKWWMRVLLSASKQRVWTTIDIVPEVNSEQCCYLSGMIGNSGWKAGSWLLFHPMTHHNTPVTHPIACLGHSWGCIVRRNERKRVVNIHFIEYESNVTSSDSAKILSLNDESYFIPFHHYKHCTTPSMSDGRLCESHVC